MPPYVIFHDATLRLIAASPPSTLNELRQINGVGDTKLDKYGQAILGRARGHVVNADAAELAPQRHAGPAGWAGAVGRIIECHNTPHGGAVTRNHGREEGAVGPRTQSPQ